MRTKNRKPVSFSSVVLHDGIKYKINGSETRGVYLQLIHKAIEQLDICIVNWGRVFAMRFDLHQKAKTTHSKMLTMFRKNLMRRLERSYQMAEMGYVWVREQEKAKKQHYHFVVFLDGDKIKHSSMISQVIIETWQNVRDGNTAYIPRRCFYHVVDTVTKAEAIYRVSYLAKIRGKGYRPPQAKDYGASRLNLTFQAAYRSKSTTDCSGL